MPKRDLSKEPEGALKLMVPDERLLSDVGHCRNEARESLRTTSMTNPSKQVSWYESLDPNVHRYWGIREDRENVWRAFGGLTYISWENRSAEISLIVLPGSLRQGFGTASVSLLLSEGFSKMGLAVIYGEVYGCNRGGCLFWESVTKKHTTSTVILPDRKLWNGQLYDSTYFSITPSYIRGPVVRQKSWVERKKAPWEGRGRPVEDVEDVEEAKDVEDKVEDK